VTINPGVVAAIHVAGVRGDPCGAVAQHHKVHHFGFPPTLIIPLMSFSHSSTPTSIETGPNRGHINTTAVLVLDTTPSFIVNLAM